MASAHPSVRVDAYQTSSPDGDQATPSTLMKAGVRISFFPFLSRATTHPASPSTLTNSPNATALPRGEMRRYPSEFTLS